MIDTLIKLLGLSWRYFSAIIGVFNKKRKRERKGGILLL